jgi:hypothetical protein
MLLSSGLFFIKESVWVCAVYRQHILLSERERAAHRKEPALPIGLPASTYNQFNAEFNSHTALQSGGRGLKENVYTFIRVKQRTGTRPAKTRIGTQIDFFFLK